MIKRFIETVSTYWKQYQANKPPFREGNLVKNKDLKQKAIVNMVFKNEDGDWVLMVDDIKWYSTDNQLKYCVDWEAKNCIRLK